MSVEEYQRIKAIARELNRQISEAEGQRKQILQEIRTKYKCKTLKDAEALLKKMEKEEKDMEDELAEKQREFNEKWKDVLNEEY